MDILSGKKLGKILATRREKANNFFLFLVLHLIIYISLFLFSCITLFFNAFALSFIDASVTHPHSDLISFQIPCSFIIACVLAFAYFVCWWWMRRSSVRRASIPVLLLRIHVSVALLLRRRWCLVLRWRGLVGHRCALSIVDLCSTSTRGGNHARVC